jgi:hypothetical protein
MLSPPNRVLAARDPALPGLGLLLDPEALARALGTSAVTLRHLRYKPGTSCTAAAVTAEGNWLRLRALTPAHYAEKGYPEDGVPGAPCLAVATPDGDKEVPGLRRFWPEDRRAKVQAEVFGESHLAEARLVPLSYRLGRRLVARLDHPLGGRAPETARGPRASRRRRPGRSGGRSTATERFCAPAPSSLPSPRAGSPARCSPRWTAPTASRRRGGAGGRARRIPCPAVLQKPRR